MNSTDTITLIRPDDWHTHLRDGAELKLTVAHTARQFNRAIVMPNLATPVTTVNQAEEYARRIIEHIPADASFTPLMTLYLTDNTRPADITQITGSNQVVACKLYPAGATTNSLHGVTSIDQLYPTLESMQEHDIPLLVHGEVTDRDIDIFDREKVFIDERLAPIHRDFPALRIVFEHITTADAVDFVTASSNRVAATLTPQHLMFNRNAILSGGIHPHYYCLPVLKRESHRLALLNAVISGNPKFFLGTDSAPHAQDKKETACGCAGIYSAHAAIEIYAEIFDRAQALDRLEGFASRFGPAFYGLPVNSENITLTRKSWTIPTDYPYCDKTLVPLLADQDLSWTLQV